MGGFFHSGMFLKFKTLISNCVSIHTEYTLAISHESDDIAESNPLERKMFA